MAGVRAADLAGRRVRVGRRSTRSSCALLDRVRSVSRRPNARGDLRDGLRGSAASIPTGVRFSRTTAGPSCRTSIWSPLAAAADRRDARRAHHARRARAARRRRAAAAAIGAASIAARLIPRDARVPDAPAVVRAGRPSRIRRSSSTPAAPKPKSKKSSAASSRPARRSTRSRSSAPRRSTRRSSGKRPCATTGR